MIDNTIRLLNGAQNYFRFTKRTDDVFDDDYINWENFRKNYQPKDQYEIHITEHPFDDNWFSHEDSEFSVITIDSWERIYSPPSLKSYMMYQIAQSAINFEINLDEETLLNMVHYKAQGCMFDFCGNKSDIKLGMIAGIICPSCKGQLRCHGVLEPPMNAIEKILHFVRHEAIGSPINFNVDAAFVIMPFAQHTESDHVFKYGIEPALKELNIKCVMGRTRVHPSQILEQIFNEIKNNRFIIVQVDNNNLNVYFELGVAMGMAKDVLLISRPEYVKQIPADLTNWECLTYETGNYEDLKDRIIKYYKNHYNY